MVTSVKHVTKSAFKAHALALLREVEQSGETLVITDHGRPVAEVRPFRAAETNPRATLRGSVIRYDRPTDPIGEEDWEALASRE